MSNINMEFNTKFDNEDYIITIQTTQDKLLITIEEEKNSVYWKKELDAKTICDITSQMGSFKSFDVFTKMLLCALQNENDNISLNFCSLNEIQQLSENKKTSLNNSSSNRTFSSDPENSIKKYLMLVYTQFEKVVYPIQLEYLDKTPDAFLLQRTITRLKSKLSNTNAEQCNNMYGTNIVNYAEYERIKNENKSLITKIKLLESNRQLGAVENDDIYRNYTALSEEYEQYKSKTESKIKMLLNSIDEIKEMQFRESKSNFNEKDKSKNSLHGNHFVCFICFVDVSGLLYRAQGNRSRGLCRRPCYTKQGRASTHGNKYVFIHSNRLFKRATAYDSSGICNAGTFATNKAQEHKKGGF